MLPSLGPSENGLYSLFHLVTAGFEKSSLENLELAATYEDDCTRVILSFQNNFPSFGNSEGIKSLTLKFQLKPFTSISMPGL